MADTDEIIRRCSTSRNLRRERNAWMNLWYRRGTDQAGPMARHNKIRAHLDLLASYLYAPESTRFALQLPPESRAQWLPHADAAREVFTERWRNAGIDVLFAQLLDAALITGAVGMKILPSGEHGFRVSCINAGDLGVLQEDLNSLDDQEAFCHWFALSMYGVDRLTEGLPNASEIRGWAAQQASPGRKDDHAPNMISQLVITSVQGPFPSTQVQGVTNLGVLGDERAQVDEPLVEAVEVWVKQEYETVPKSGTGLKPYKFWDWEVITYLGEYEVMRRRNPTLGHKDLGTADLSLAAENPVVALVPNPARDYFWGVPEPHGLIQLQQWREQTMTDLGQLFQRQIDPSGVVSGVMGMNDEKARTLRTPGSWISGGQMNAKIDSVPVPDVNDKGYALVDRIDSMFADASGIPEILQAGMSAAGGPQRSADQVTAQANIAVGRIRRKALIVEDAIEVLATRLFHLLQRVDDTMYQTEDGKQHFLLSQLPAATTVKVSAHTASPVYRQELKLDADRLLKAGAVDLVDYVELLDPPNKDELKAKARVLQQQKAELIKKRLEIEEQKAKKKR